MRFGPGIFLLVVGAILAFAVKDSIDAVDLTLVGYIMMGAGALGIILGVAMANRKQTATSTTRSAVDPVSGEGVSQTERTIS